MSEFCIRQEGGTPMLTVIKIRNNIIQYDLIFNHNLRVKNLLSLSLFVFILIVIINTLLQGL